MSNKEPNNEWNELHQYFNNVKEYLNLTKIAELSNLSYYRLKTMLTAPYTKMRYTDYLELKELKRKLIQIFNDKQK